MKLLIHSQHQRLHRWHFGMETYFRRTICCWACAYLSMLGFNLIQVSKGARGSPFYWQWLGYFEYFFRWKTEEIASLNPTLALSMRIITRRTLPIMHYNDVIMSTMASQITSLTIVYSSVYSGADQRKHQSSVSLAFVTGLHRWPMNSPHKGPVTRRLFPFDDVIMEL